MLLNSNLKKVALVTFLSLGAIACNNDDDAVIIPDEPNSIVDIVENSADYSSLSAALEVAGLKAILDGDTEYTVFAPNNAAFNEFLSDNGYANLSAVPVDVLTQVLLNHVLVGANFAADLSTGYVETASTFSPGENNLSMYIGVGANVVINGISTVTQANIVADNGVIHAVDAVIGIPTVVTFAAADPNFSTLVSALTDLTPDTDFVSILSRTEAGNLMDGINPDFTVFAPTNDAFDALDAIPGEDVLTQVLLHHVISEANITSGDLNNPGDTTAETLEGDNITITLPGTGGNIANITDGSGASDIGIIAVNVQAGNGVIHVINKVMIPNL